MSELTPKPLAVGDTIATYEEAERLPDLAVVIDRGGTVHPVDDSNVRHGKQRES